MPTKEEIELSYRISTIIACDVAKVYTGAMATIYKDHNKYIHNKCADAEKSCDLVMGALSRDIKGIIPDFKEVVERNMGIIYDTIGLSLDNQRRVYSLVKKLKREEDANTTGE